MENGIIELKFNTGERIYLAATKNSIIILLLGGDKTRQSDDIKKAEQYLLDYQGSDKMDKRTFPELKIEDYLKDNPEFQKGYLDEALNEYFQDGDLSAFLHCLKPLIKVRVGSVSEFSQRTGLNRTYYYKLFNNEIVPDFSKVLTIIRGLGFDLKFNLVTEAA